MSLTTSDQVPDVQILKQCLVQSLVLISDNFLIIYHNLSDHLRALIECMQELILLHQALMFQTSLDQCPHVNRCLIQIGSHVGVGQLLRLLNLRLEQQKLAR